RVAANGVSIQTAHSFVALRARSKSKAILLSRCARVRYAPPFRWKGEEKQRLPRLYPLPRKGVAAHAAGGCHHAVQNLPPNKKRGLRAAFFVAWSRVSAHPCAARDDDIPSSITARRSSPA